MKNLFYSLAFMLIGSFSFANSIDVQSSESQIKNELVSIEKFNNLNLESFSFEENQINEDLLECHVKIKGTINGKPVDIDVTFTSDSGSCVKDTVKLLQDL